MQQLEINDIVRALSINDDEQAFKQFFIYFNKKLFVFAISFVKDKQLAEEVVQDVFTKIWLNRKNIASIDNITYYLFTATKNTALNYLEKNKNKKIILKEIDSNYFTSQSPEQSVQQKENINTIELAISNLPPKCQLVFKLIKENGLQYKQVAELLSISVKTVEAHMSLAYARIIEVIESKIPEAKSIISKKA